MIDANGYVVYAQDEKHLGRFFGEVEGAVMEQMIALNIFRKLSMYDYQAFDNEPKSTTPSSASNFYNVRKSFQVKFKI